MHVLFIHGGGDGAFAFDRAIVSGMTHALDEGVAVHYPHIEGLEQIDWDATQPRLNEVFHDLQGTTTVVAHSIGAAAVLKFLSSSEAGEVAKPLSLGTAL